MACAIGQHTNPVHGFVREDGSRENLTLNDLSLCFEAKGRLREASIAGLCRVLRTGAAPTCKVASQCTRALKTVFRGDQVEGNVYSMMTYDVLLNTVSNYFGVEGDQNKYVLCQACLDMVRQRDAQENRALWDRLPELLGIEVPGWKKPAAPPGPA